MNSRHGKLAEDWSLPILLRSHVQARSLSARGRVDLQSFEDATNQVQAVLDTQAAGYSLNRLRTAAEYQKEVLARNTPEVAAMRTPT